MVILKGSPKGIMISVDDTNYENGQKELAEKLSASVDFFRGAELSVFLTSNSLTEAEVFFLRDTVCRTLTETTVEFITEEPKMLPQKHSDIDALDEDESVTKYVRRTVKSGETIHFEHSLMIIGDVEEGAKVSAGKNVTVMGNLFGVVHAGAGGNRHAVIIAGKLMPQKLMIADMSVPVKQSTIKRLIAGKPEIAYVFKNTIKIEQYT